MTKQLRVKIGLHHRGDHIRGQDYDRIRRLLVHLRCFHSQSYRKELYRYPPLVSPSPVLPSSTSCGSTASSSASGSSMGISSSSSSGSGGSRMTVSTFGHLSHQACEHSIIQAINSAAKAWACSDSPETS